MVATIRCCVSIEPEASITTRTRFPTFRSRCFPRRSDSPIRTRCVFRSTCPPAAAANSVASMAMSLPFSHGTLRTYRPRELFVRDVLRFPTASESLRPFGATILRTSYGSDGVMMLSSTYPWQ